MTCRVLYTTIRPRPLGMTVDTLSGMFGALQKKRFAIEVAMMRPFITQFFTRKVKIVVLTALTYAALC